MNPLPPNADELVSAYLDGQAAPDEILVVESSPELMERVQSLRSVANLIGESPTPPAAQKEAHLSAALDAFDALFATESSESEPVAATAPLAAVPTTPEPAVVPPAVEAAATPADSPPGVTSLAAARERRRPRRFNPGVIAAAAVVLLFVALAAFGLGGGEDSLDVASSEAAGEASSNLTSVETSSDAMSDDAAMDDAESGGLSEIAPSPTAGAAAAAPQAAAADEGEDAMADEEEAMDDEEAMSDSMNESAAEAPEADFDDSASDEAGAAAESLAAEPFRLFAGEFDDQDDLLLELKQLPVDEFAERAQPIEPGLFDSCQPDVSILSDIATPTIVGDALLAGDLIEIHRIGDGDDVVIVLVDPTDCSIVHQTP